MPPRVGLCAAPSTARRDLQVQPCVVGGGARWRSARVAWRGQSWLARRGALAHYAGALTRSIGCLIPLRAVRACGVAGASAVASRRADRADDAAASVVRCPAARDRGGAVLSSPTPRSLLARARRLGWPAGSCRVSTHAVSVSFQRCVAHDEWQVFSLISSPIKNGIACEGGRATDCQVYLAHVATLHIGRACRTFEGIFLRSTRASRTASHGTGV